MVLNRLNGARYLALGWCRTRAAVHWTAVLASAPGASNIADHTPQTRRSSGEANVVAKPSTVSQGGGDISVLTGGSTVATKDFDGAVEGYRQALHAYVKGDPSPVTEFFSRRDDVTLANPLGPARRGPAEVDKAIAEGAAMLKDGSVRGVEEVSRYSTPNLGYVVQVERTQGRGCPVVRTWCCSLCGSP